MGLLEDLIQYGRRSGRNVGMGVDALVDFAGRFPERNAERNAAQRAGNDATMKALRGVPLEEPEREALVGAPASGMGVGDIGGAVPGLLMAGTFAGAKSPMANKAQLRRAKSLIKRGTDPEQVRQQTGWHQGPDGEWRWEFSDDLAEIKADPVTGEETLYHPQLRNAYPDLHKGLKIERFTTTNRENRGRYDPKTKTMYLGSHVRDANDAMEVIIHELQHAVQEAEGFSPGANMTQREILDQAQRDIDADRAKAQKYIDDYRAGLDQFKASEKARGSNLNETQIEISFNRQNPDLHANAMEGRKQLRFLNDPRAFNEVTYQTYERTMGEFEARESMERRTMTPDERRANPPYNHPKNPMPPQGLLDMRVLRAQTQGQGGGTVPYIDPLPSNEPSAKPPAWSEDPPAMVAKSPGKGMLFDYSGLGEVPDVPQRGLERYIPPRGVSERAQKLDDPKVIKRVEKYTDRGLEMGGDEWYNTEPLRHAFMEQLGEAEGNRAYQQYMQMVAATSPQLRVPINIRNASYFYGLLRRGEPIPEKPPLPPPYGSKAQNLHIQNANTVAGPGWDVLRNPKPPSYAENLMGNQRPVTVDTHNTRAWGILSRDPAWVAGTNAEDKARKPRLLLEAGTKLEDLKPTDFVSQPNQNEYGFMEQLQQRRAARKGLSPAQYQAATWVGAGDVTGLGSPPEPFLRTVERRVVYTAEQRGETPSETLRKFITGEAPLLAVAPVGVLGATDADSDLRPVPTDERAQGPVHAFGVLPGGLLGDVKKNLKAKQAK